MSTISRIKCPHCAAECMEREVNCWQCGKLLRPPPEKSTSASTAPQPLAPASSTPAPAESDRKQRSLFKRKEAPKQEKKQPEGDPITYSGIFAEEKVSRESQGAEETPATQPAKRVRTTLTGEVIEEEEAEEAPVAGVAAAIGGKEIAAEPASEAFIQSFCRNCGYQNPEGVRECVRCKIMLEVLEAPPPEIEMPPRRWGFDVLGALWIILGLGSVFAGMFLLRLDPNKKSWADYFWTGLVVCAPGIFIFVRWVACKVIFWVMTFAAAMVWAVIGFLWILGHLQVSDNGQVGLIWLALFSVLALVSWVVVRLNDDFDFTL